MRAILNFLKELFLIKQESKVVGLTSLKKSQNAIVKKEVKKKKEEKELKLSDLMRRKKPQNAINYANSTNTVQSQTTKPRVKNYSQKIYNY